MGYDFELVRGGQPAALIPLKARLQPMGPLRMAGEVYPQRLSVRWADAATSLTVLLLVQGSCIVEADGAMQLLQASGSNAVVLPAAAHDFTITQAPCRLVRLLLPPGSRLEGGAGAPASQPLAWCADLALLLPMQRLLEQSLHHAAAEHTRHELADTLLAYLLDRLAAAGCRVELPQPSRDPIEQLEVWLTRHLGQPLALADLASVVNLSPRRLQELCRQRHGCSPMDLLRQQRLALLARQLRDPALAAKSLAALMAALQLSDSASTRQAFERAYGCSPAAYRRGARAAQLA